MANSHGSSHGNFPVQKLSFRGNGSGNGKKRLPTVNLNFHGKNCLAPANCLDGFTGQLGQAVGQAVCRASPCCYAVLGGTSHAQRFALACGVGVGRAVGRAKAPIGRVLGVVRARALGCWAGHLAPSGPGPDVGRRREMSGVGRCFSMALPVVWKCFPWLGVVFQWLSTVVAQGVGQGVGHAVGRTVRRNWLLGETGRLAVGGASGARALGCWAGAWSGVVWSAGVFFRGLG